MKRLILAITVAHFLLSAAAAPARQAAPATTALTILPLQPKPLGDLVQVVAQLMSDAGLPVAGEPLSLSRHGYLDQLSYTDEDGYAYFNFQATPGTGTYPLRIAYAGASDFSPTESSVDLVIVPNALEIQVVPPIPGIEFSLNGMSFQSAPDGIARTEVDYPGIYHLELLPVHQSGLGHRTEFKRWEEDIFATSRDVYLPDKLDLVVGFEQFFPVRLNFVDLLGRPVDPQRVASVTLRSSHGATNTYRLDRPIYLQRNRIARRLNGLDEVNIRYSLLSVMVDGSNTVNQGQQVFEVAPDDPWRVELLLFSARFKAREVFFAYPLGKGIELTYPDGRVARLPFNPERSVTLDGLARGLYYVRVYGAPGISIFTPLMISREQEAELLVYGYPSLALVILLPLATAVLLLVLGRSRAKAAARYFAPNLEAQQE